jgi:hypothetical protein
MGIWTQTVRQWTAVRALDQPIRIFGDLVRGWSVERPLSQPVGLMHSAARQVTALRLPAQSITLQSLSPSLSSPSLILD